MGKVVYHWDDLRHTAFDTSPLRLTAIASTTNFYYLISDATGMPCAARGVLMDRKYHFFDKPLGYLGRLIGEDDLLFADFEKVSVAVRGIPFTAFPARSANQEFIRAQIVKTTDLSPADQIFLDRIDDGLSFAFALPDMFSREANAWFSNATVSHVMSALVSHGIDISEGSNKTVLILNMAHDLVEMVLCDDGSLIFANHFRVSAPEDVLYFILAVLRDQDVDATRCRVVCAGHEVHQIQSLLNPYFADIEMYSTHGVGLPDDFPISDTMDLICVSKCAS